MKRRPERFLIALITASLLTSCIFFDGTETATGQPTATISETATSVPPTELNVTAESTDADPSVTETAGTGATGTAEPSATERAEPTVGETRDITYTEIADPTGKSYAAVPDILLNNAGIRLKLEHVKSKEKFGTVLEIDFDGYKEGDRLFVKDGSDIKLTLSRNDLPDVKGTPIYLTFDDGPYVYSPQILDILKERGVRATFFQVGVWMKYYSSHTKRAYDEGHVIGCHSYDHVYRSVFASSDSFFKELSDWESAAEEVIGTRDLPKIFRFPGGSLKYLMKEELKSKGYRGYDWNVINGDCNLPMNPDDISAEEYLRSEFLKTFIYSFHIKGAPKIILMHEVYPETVDMLNWTIDYIESLGCEFATLDTLDESWYHLHSD